MVTSAPARASERAVSIPIPEAPPVTMARFPREVHAGDDLIGRCGGTELRGDSGHDGQPFSVWVSMARRGA